MSNYTIAEVDLSLLHNNIKIIRSITDNVKLLNIVKANAYGHGIIEISKASERFGADVLGVATVEEGIRIRESGVSLPIIVLFQHFKDESDLVCKYNLIPIISNADCLEYYDRYLKKYGGKLKLYIKVDTGLNRMGARPEEVLSLAKKVLSYDTLSIEGINTHYAAADMQDEYSKDFTNNQIRIFNEVLNELKSNGIEINNAHTANSAALVSYRNTYFDMVRAGIILYGYIYDDYDLGDTRVAVIPIGYADGVPRGLSNNWEVKINGNYYPIRGRVCMDTIVVDVGNGNVNVEDEVLIFGNDERINANTLAKRINGISHEILVNIGERVTRVYKE